MCKIILKFGHLSTKLMEQHRERCEDGCGALFYKDTFIAVKEMSHDALYKSMEKIAFNSPFTLFHSRAASHGDICLSNAQPFHNDNIAFVHNGTVSSRDLLLLNALTVEELSGAESDSLLLFNMLKLMNWNNLKVVLENYDHNFIALNKEKEEIFIYGRYKVIYSKPNTIGYLKNSFSEAKSRIITDFNGNIKEKIELEVAWSSQITSLDLPGVSRYFKLGD